MEGHRKPIVVPKKLMEEIHGLKQLLRSATDLAPQEKNVLQCIIARRCTELRLAANQ